MLNSVRARKESIVNIFLSEKTVVYPLGKPSIPASATHPVLRFDGSGHDLGGSEAWSYCGLGEMFSLWSAADPIPILLQSKAE